MKCTLYLMRCDSSFPGQISEAVSTLPRGGAGYDGRSLCSSLLDLHITTLYTLGKLKRGFYK